MTGKHYRLPTEAEWEYAAKGGSQTHNYDYAGGSDINAVAWYYNNSGYTTHPIGLKRANELGIYDMSGNVYQWCSDWYDYYTISPDTNPQGPVTGKSRVIRGGCSISDPALCRVTYRWLISPYDHHNIIGFRVASSL